MPTIYVSVCKNVILSNRKQAKNDPPIRVSQGKHGKPMHVHAFSFDGKGTLVYSPDEPMPWGARAWLQVEGRLANAPTRRLPRG